MGIHKPVLEKNSFYKHFWCLFCKGNKKGCLWKHDWKMLTYFCIQACIYTLTYIHLDTAECLSFTCIRSSSLTTPHDNPTGLHWWHRKAHTCISQLLFWAMYSLCSCLTLWLRFRAGRLKNSLQLRLLQIYLSFYKSHPQSRSVIQQAVLISRQYQSLGIIKTLLPI